MLGNPGRPGTKFDAEWLGQPPIGDPEQRPRILAGAIQAVGAVVGPPLGVIAGHVSAPEIFDADVVLERTAAPALLRDAAAVGAGDIGIGVGLARSALEGGELLVVGIHAGLETIVMLHTQAADGVVVLRVVGDLAVGVAR